MSTPLRIGLVGGGVVGGGVVELISRISSPLATVQTVVVRDASKPRDFALPKGVTLTSDMSKVLEDDSINCVVEVMGGCGVAKDVVLQSLARGKHVVTANKALVATHMPEIEAAARAAPGGAKLAFEAAVCGAIPIINTLQTCYVGDVVTSVQVSPATRASEAKRSEAKRGERAERGLGKSEGLGEERRSGGTPGSRA
jgi:homoserine dehydrogenase